MKRRLALLLVSAGAVALAADGPFSLPPETARFRNGPGVEAAIAQCSLCHSPDYISTQPPLTRAQWQATVTKMQQRYGAPVPTNSVERIVEYLVKTYGNEAVRK